MIAFAAKLAAPEVRIKPESEVDIISYMKIKGSKVDG